MYPTVSSESIEQPTDRANLSGYLSWIWRMYFVDIPQANIVNIEYGYPWKSRLGRIRLSLDGSSSLIEVNALLQLHQVPECVFIATISHELVHYAHGFGSPLPRKYKHPHAHQVVSRELEQRGLEACLQRSKEWIDQYWYTFYNAQRAVG